MEDIREFNVTGNQKHKYFPFNKSSNCMIFDYLGPLVTAGVSTKTQESLFRAAARKINNHNVTLTFQWEQCKDVHKKMNFSKISKSFSRPKLRRAQTLGNFAIQISRTWFNYSFTIFLLFSQVLTIRNGELKMKRLPLWVLFCWIKIRIKFGNDGSGKHSGNLWPPRSKN